MRKIIVTIILIGSALTTVGAPARAEESKATLAAVAVYSDPPGAHIYTHEGKYFGQTNDEASVVITYTWSGVYHPTPEQSLVLITAEKRGYKTGSRNVPLQFEYQTESQAWRNRTRTVIVLQPAGDE